jgi:hypothetical protein
LAAYGSLSEIFGIRVVTEERAPAGRSTTLWIAMADTAEQAVRIVEATVGPGSEVEATGHVFPADAIAEYDLRPGTAQPV